MDISREKFLSFKKLFIKVNVFTRSIDRVSQTLKDNLKSLQKDYDLFYPKRTTIASFPGGKSDRRKHQPLFRSVPQKISYLVEPFAGLANFFIVISPRVSKAWLNDKDPEIYSLLRCLNDISLLKKLIEQVKLIEPVEKDEYYEWKASSPDDLVSIAVKRLVILNCSVNGAGGGYSKEKSHRKWYQNKPKIWHEINQLFKQKKVKITNLDYTEVFCLIQELPDLDDSFIYLDPPYDTVAQQGKLYGKAYNLIDWKQLKGDLIELKVHWILSNRDSPEVRAKFSDFHQFAYNTYNDMNNTLNRNPELLISNRLFV
jgi:DNA adenine methylase